MDDYLSESEQVEQVKAWLRANVPWILAGIAVGGLAIVGWRWWQSHTDQLDLQAGAEYQQVLQAFNAGDKSRGLALVGDLERDHAGSPYTDQANLAAARVLVETNELDRAAQHLEAVERESHDPELATIARLRLARVQISLGKPDEALATLGAPLNGAFALRYHEVRGDAYFAKGQKAAALDEYRAARLAAGPTLAENDVLNLKIHDLTGATGRAAPQPSAASGAGAAGGTSGAGAAGAAGDVTHSPHTASSR
ncbi:MAG TPA: tetratricopeptide repeat protein [Steroidobacteraceae bacterium]|nr:tetratricopeptide repeat protein [Steroidobacteraceae bacterium]